MKKITGKQLRMARASLKYRVDDISKETGVSWAKVQLFERTDSEIDSNDKINQIISFFESKKIIFENGNEEYLPFIKIKR